MIKDKIFTGQPIFTQLIKLISRNKIVQLAREHGTDRYYKKLKTYEHLVSMMYTVLSKCTSIREVVTGLVVCGGKLNHLGISYTPAKSTLSDANCKRDAGVFEAIYGYLYDRFAKHLPDSRSYKWYKRLFIMDSTTISLFQEILKNSGLSPLNGKRKGGIKVHTLIKADEDVPRLVRFTPGAAHDSPFMKQISLPEGSIIVFDKGYHNYKIYNEWTENKITFVTRLRSNTVYEAAECRKVNSNQQEKGIISDEEIIMGHSHQKDMTKVRARLIRYYDKATDKEFAFITNNFRMAPYTITQIYQRRWQIETLYKRIKQNYPLRYFLGDNENAIKIQIWCALIVDFLLKLIQKQVHKRWAFSNLSSIVRLHLMTYIDLKSFLNDPERAMKTWKDTEQQYLTPSLFPT